MTSAGPAVLFVGPTMPAASVRDAFHGEILPPIRRGDLDRLLSRSAPPSAVGIIDGVFFQDMAVSPKELVRALDRGIPVYGSSSIGALRAVECGPFGMIGVGEIHRMYATGEIDADDEVAITYDPDSLLPLCEPMVNIRIALRAAATAGLVPAATAEDVIAVARAMYFPERSYRNLLRVVRTRVEDTAHAALTDFLLGGSAPDQKRSDALLLLREMSPETP